MGTLEQLLTQGTQPYAAPTPAIDTSGMQQKRPNFLQRTTQNIKEGLNDAKMNIKDAWADEKASLGIGRKAPTQPDSQPVQPTASAPAAQAQTATVPAPTETPANPATTGTPSQDVTATSIETGTQPVGGAEATESTETVQQQQKPVRSYEDMWEAMGIKPMSQEEEEKARKKAKRDQLWASIGDGISALSNLYFTSKYAPNMYNPANNSADKVKSKWDKIFKDNDAQKQAYLSGKMQAMKWDRDAADKEKAAEQAQQNWQANFDFSKEQAEKENARKDKAAEQAQANWLATFGLNKDKLEEGKREFDANHRLAWARLNASLAGGGGSGSSSGGSGSGSSKNAPARFVSSDKKTDISIDSNDWKNNLRLVYTQLSDALGTKAKTKDRNAEPTYADMENYVGQNWDKVPQVRDYMIYLANRQGGGNDEEDIIDYIPQQQVTADTIDYTPQPQQQVTAQPQSMQDEITWQLLDAVRQGKKKREDNEKRREATEKLAQQRLQANPFIAVNESIHP